MGDMHQNHLAPEDNKFHKGNGDDGKHYWLTPPDLYKKLAAEFRFDFDPCPFPKPDNFDGLTCEWGQSSYVNSWKPKRFVSLTPARSQTTRR
jgi:hypothetical protein